MLLVHDVVLPSGIWATRQAMPERTNLMQSVPLEIKGLPVHLLPSVQLTHPQVGLGNLSIGYRCTDGPMERLY